MYDPLHYVLMLPYVLNIFKNIVTVQFSNLKHMEQMDMVMDYVVLQIFLLQCIVFTGII